ncbi:MAG: DUF1549 domain-containing protein, partial [Planctomycetota bacterium]|nr:DUF1549 domain-containing protein [Planctomycetota bacterium]
MLTRILVAISLLLPNLVFDTCRAQESVSPTDALWNQHVADLLKANCQKCHNEKKKSARLDLTTAATALKGGKNGAVIQPGNPAQSLLFQLVQKNAKPHMPPGDKQLSQEELSILKRWIEKMKPDASLPPVSSVNHAPGSKPGASNLPDQLDPKTVIDLLFEKNWKVKNIPVANRCTDDQFVRRIYLDLIGRIPNLAELKEFRENTDSSKREQLVDQLLATDEHALFFASVFDTLFMGRAQEAVYLQRNNSGWNAFLSQAFKDNRPWNEVVQDILLARPDDQSKRGATWFLFERNNQHQAIAEAIGPSVFGIRIECAQCHDHPIAGEI